MFTLSDSFWQSGLDSSSFSESMDFMNHLADAFRKRIFFPSHGSVLAYVHRHVLMVTHDHSVSVVDGRGLCDCEEGTNISYMLDQMLHLAVA
jgi:hypothetical protein